MLCRNGAIGLPSLPISKNLSARIPSAVTMQSFPYVTKKGWTNVLSFLTVCLKHNAIDTLPANCNKSNCNFQMLATVNPVCDILKSESYTRQQIICTVMKMYKQDSFSIPDGDLSTEAFKDFYIQWCPSPLLKPLVHRICKIFVNIFLTKGRLRFSQNENLSIIPLVLSESTWIAS